MGNAIIIYLNMSIVKLDFFNQLNSKYQNVFLVASSLGHKKAEKLNNRALEFFKQNSVLNAQIFLNSLILANSRTP